jgi:hypothetical protein
MDIIDPFPLTSSRAYALGGPHVAYPTDTTTLAVNPGALRVMKKQRSIAEIGAGGHGNVFGLLSLIGSTEDFDSGKIQELTDGSGGKIPLGLELRGPLSAGYINNGFGFSVSDRIYLDAKFIGTTVRVNMKADLLINGGYAYRLVDRSSGTLDIGFTGKLFGRYMAGINESLLDFASDPGSLSENLPLDLIGGAGVDLGVLYYFKEQFALGLTCNDVFSIGMIQHSDDSGESSSVGLINPQINFGAAYTFPAWRFTSLSIMLDYRDVVNIFTNDYTTRNPVLNLGLGIEARIINFIYARFGVNDMLPAVGLGFDLKILKIDTALYGKELSTEPGGMSTYAFDISLLFRY